MRIPSDIFWRCKVFEILTTLLFYPRFSVWYCLFGFLFKSSKLFAKNGSASVWKYLWSCIIACYLENLDRTFTKRIGQRNMNEILSKLQSINGSNMQYLRNMQYLARFSRYEIICTGTQFLSEKINLTFDVLFSNKFSVLNALMRFFMRVVLNEFTWRVFLDSTKTCVNF